MIDKTLDIQSRARKPLIDIPLQDSCPSQDRSFLELASECQHELSLISMSVSQLSKLRHKLYVTTSAKEDASNVEDCEKLTRDINKQIDAVRESIADVSLLCKADDAAHAKIRSNMYSGLLRRFQTIIKQYHSIQSEILTIHKDKAVRLLRISSNEGLSDGEARTLIDKGITAGDAMRAQLSADLETMTLRSRLAAVTDKIHDLKVLTESVRVLNMMFVEMSQLVVQQGEAIDSIEYTVVNTKNYTLQARDSLIQAKKKQRSSMKCMIWMFSLLFILIGVAVASYLWKHLLP